MTVSGLALALVVCLLGLAGFARGQAPRAGATPPPSSWPMFGHDLANSRDTPVTTIGPRNVRTLRQIWRAPGEAVTSTPAVVNGVVYYSDFGGNLIARRAGSGGLVWRAHLQPGQLSVSPFVAAGSVYTAGDDGMVFAVDRRTGRPEWKRRIERAPNSRIWSSPVRVGNTLIVGSASFQVFIPGHPAFQGSVVGLNASTGAIRWRAKVCTGSCTGVSVWSSAAIDPALHLAYIGTGQSYTPPAGPMSDSLVAINYQTGHIVWSRQYTAGDVYSATNPSGHDWDVGAAPNLFSAHGRELVGAGDKGGTYRAFDARTGRPVWSRRLVAGTALGGIEETTAYAHSTIYAVANTQIAATNRLDAVPSAAKLFALNASNGHIRWQRKLPAGGFGGIAVAGEVLFFTTWDGILRANDARTGATLLTKYIGDRAGASAIERGAAGGPSIVGDQVYVGYGWNWLTHAPGGIRVLGLCGRDMPRGAGSHATHCR